MEEPVVVFISGVSKGLGKELARVYLSRPNHIVVGSIRDTFATDVADLKSMKSAEGSRILLVSIENTSIDDPAKALDDIKAAGIGHLDIVIANAGGGGDDPKVSLETIDMKEMTTRFQSNALGPLLLYQTFRPLLQKSRRTPKWISMSTAGGSIELIGATRATMLPAYSASKAALNWLTRAIHFNNDWLIAIAMHPGLVQTGPGNWFAGHLGLEKAPLTIDFCVEKMVDVIDHATREETSGKFISAIEGTELPW
ncbi:aflatoxin biosynthesis ketoreductase nor-1 [Hypoxylon trugodes]|uniref:aflatoxin biosynthesis ketoreductase nor-1 n=1 Tax=Hypoxylon trugodes TaxID=326681 RepID=UPI002190E73A|nr:aflatoxin biosynthesis ketoreductase nor-1 [Hypoxylon trugodes]KAI1385987.1 aflatoxin biosynthesis ketoreductase nor-1 [Hypoxylon trugodes]